VISVHDSNRLKAVALVMRGLERPVVREINTRTRDELGPLWKSLVELHAQQHVDFQVLAKGARLKPGNPPQVIAASSRRRMAGGLIPAEQFHIREFGGTRDALTTYSRRGRRGGTHQVTRHTARQLPPRYRKGRVVWPAFAEFAPRAVSLWVQTVVRTVMDAVDKEAN